MKCFEAENSIHHHVDLQATSFFSSFRKTAALIGAAVLHFRIHAYPSI
jgi:hypothetical protein